jgi:hypothetical protein
VKPVVVGLCGRVHNDSLHAITLAPASFPTKVVRSSILEVSLLRVAVVPPVLERVLKVILLLTSRDCKASRGC